MSRCLICKEHYFDGNVLGLSTRPHVCPPAWLVRHPDYDPEDACRVYAVDAATAAANFIEDIDRAGADVTGHATVLVAKAPAEDVGDDDAAPSLDWHTYIVESEILINYTARMQTQ